MWRKMTLIATVLRLGCANLVGLGWEPEFAFVTGKASYRWGDYGAYQGARGDTQREKSVRRGCWKGFC